MLCDNDPGPKRDALGVCHVCAHRDRLPAVLQVFAGMRDRGYQPIKFCSRCCHWFCEECWTNIMGRLMGFSESVLAGSPKGCCGPIDQGPDDFTRDALPLPPERS